jgi:Transglutaminase-like superfamily
MWRLRPKVLCGALWATVAYARIRRDLRNRGVRATVISTWRLPRSSGLGVSGALARLHPSCLEKALIQQRWQAAHGIRLDVVVGVPKTGFAGGPAHAWLDGFESADEYVPIHTFPAPSARHSS